jgi:hypothetical protein
MIAILFVLVAIYYVVYLESRPKPEKPHPLKRMFVIASMVVVCLYGYSHYKANRPPIVDYYRVGWFFQIQDLNTYFARLGSANRIPIPEDWK